MIQGYIYDKAKRTKQPIYIPSENKFSNLCVNLDYGFVAGLDNNRIRIFNNYRSDSGDEIELTSNIEISDVKTFKTFVLNGFLYFVYLIDVGEIKNKIYIVSLNINKNLSVTEKIIDIEKCEKNLIYVATDNTIIFSINENNINYYSILENRNYSIEFNKNNVIDLNSICRVDTKKYIDEENSEMYSKYKIKSEEIPLFFGKYSENKSILFFINTKKSIIYKQFILNESYNKIKSCTIDYDNDLCVTFNIFNTVLNKVVKTHFTFDSTKKNNVNLLDTDIIIDAGVNISEDECVKVNMKTYSPSYYGTDNEVKIYSKPINVDKQISNVLDSNEQIETNSVDNLNVKSEVTFANGDNIYKESFDNIDDIFNIIENSKSFNSLDDFGDDQDVDAFSENTYKENLIVQEFSKDKIATTISSVKQNDEKRNIHEVSYNFDKNNNITTTIDGVNSNTTDNEYKNNVVQINTLDIPMNEFNDIIFPFINIAFKKFGSMSYSREDLDIIYSLYMKNVKFYKREKTLSENTNYKFGNVKINYIISSIVDKMNGEGKNVSDDEVARFVGEFFGPNGSKIYLDRDSTNIYKYINKYGGYKLN